MRNTNFMSATGYPQTTSGIPIAADMVKLRSTRTVCIYGVDDQETLCPSLPQQNRRVALPGTHHFNGDYETVAKTILAQMEAAPDLVDYSCSSVL